MFGCLKFHWGRLPDIAGVISCINMAERIFILNAFYGILLSAGIFAFIIRWVNQALSAPANKSRN